MRGTLLNAGAVVVGSSIGLAAGAHLPDEWRSVALHGLGLVVTATGVKMFLPSKNPLVAAISVAVGGVLGAALGLHAGVESFAHIVEKSLGAQGQFSQGMVASFVLFCVGPLTLLGCLQDGVEGKIEILALKSTLDGIASVFLAAATGAGVLVSALLLLVFQGGLTLGAKPLKTLFKDESLMQETEAVGGAILVATGLGLLEIVDLKATNYLPAVFLAPFVASALGRIKRPVAKSNS